MAFLLLHEHIAPYGWTGIAGIAIMCYLLVQIVGWLGLLSEIERVLC